MECPHKNGNSSVYSDKSSDSSRFSFRIGFAGFLLFLLIALKWAFVAYNVNLLLPLRVPGVLKMETFRNTFWKKTWKEANSARIWFQTDHLVNAVNVFWDVDHPNQRLREEVSLDGGVLQRAECRGRVLLTVRRRAPDVPDEIGSSISKADYTENLVFFPDARVMFEYQGHKEGVAEFLSTVATVEFPHKTQ